MADSDADCTLFIAIEKIKAMTYNHKYAKAQLCDRIVGGKKMISLKRWVSMLLVLALLIGCMSFAAAAADDFVINDGILTKYKGNDTIITLPASVKVVGAAAFKDNLTIEEVDLNKATTIYPNAFSGCKELTTVKGLKNVTRIYSGAFYNCTKLENGGQLSSSLTTIPKETFRNCISLKSIVIPSSVTAILDNAFDTCTSLYNATIPSETASIGASAFANCTGLIQVIVSGSVTTVGENAFSNCPKLKIVCYRGSAAETYAKDNNMRYESLAPVIDSIKLGDTRYTLIYTKDNPGKVTISATIKPDVAADAEVGWTSSNDGIAVVDASGNVTSVSQGEVTITAVGADRKAIEAVDENGNTYTVIGDKAGASASAKVAVLKPVAGGWQLVGGNYYFCTSADSYQTGWMQQDGKYYYFNGYGIMLTGWQKLGGKYYYFRPTGEMVTGWVLYNGVWYLLDSNGALIDQANWYKVNNKWYYVLSDGTAATGWQKVGNAWYYLNPATAEMVTGWQVIDGKWYFFEPGGNMHTGWVVYGNQWYYMLPSGEMAVGWVNDRGTYYHMAGNGIMQTGWLNDGGEWYYLEPGSGAMVKGWQKIKDVWYYFNPSGEMRIGWLQEDGKWYYLEPGSGAMVTGTRTIDGKKYTFGADGILK